MKRHIHTFEQLRDVGHKYYNDTNFCGVVAIAVAGQVAFGKARAISKRLGRRHRKGTHIEIIEQALLELDCSMAPIANFGKTLGSACRNTPKTGTFLIWTTRHITCVDAGQIIDWATTTRRHKVYKCFEVTRNF
jgi:hypothetical protein